MLGVEYTFDRGAILVSPLDIRHISELARLEPSEDELRSLESDLVEILSYISLLDEVACDEAEAAAEAPTSLREDRARESMPLEKFLDNAPDTLDRFLIVPSIK